MNDGNKLSSRSEIKFNLKELGGALGDFGPLHPLFLAYVKMINLDASAIMFVMGISNVLIGAYYNLPLPIEPMKAIAIYALAHKWNATLVYATAFGTAIIWIMLSLTGFIDKILKFVPESVARGIQLGLAMYLLVESIELMQTSILLAIASIGMIALFSMPCIRYIIPATILLFGLGIAIVAREGFPVPLNIYVPRINTFQAHDVWRGMLEVGFIQIFLTLSNAVLATRIAVNEKFSRKVSDGQLALNMGLMNFLAAFFGCIPLCHGVGGFMAQYFYGARTGGAMIMEGFIELISAIFFSTTVIWIFSKFPLAIIGAMLLPVSIELGKSILVLKRRRELIVAAIVATLSYLTNLGIGFIVGITMHYLLSKRKAITKRVLILIRGLIV
jgi:MFS superfamily sulfate permease-like transporter